MGSFITSTSVTVPNWPKYSRSRSWFVCQLRPPTNSFPGAESELGVLRPLDSPCKIVETLKHVLFLDFVFLSRTKVVSCSPNHFLQLVKFEPQELPVSTQLKLKSFQFFSKESWIIFLLLHFRFKNTIFWSWYFLTCLGSDIIWGERELRQPGELVHREPEMIKWYQLTIVKVLSSKISKFLSHFISWRSHIVSASCEKEACEDNLIKTFWGLETVYGLSKMDLLRFITSYIWDFYWHLCICRGNKLLPPRRVF